MYIRRIVDKNIGPISSLDLNMPFTDEGNPKPLLIVGENGSGKSTFLSNIVDALYELAKDAFSNVSYIIPGSQSVAYFKIMSNLEIHSGEEYLFSYIQFDEDIRYIYKIGNLKSTDFMNISGAKTDGINWDDKKNIKQTIHGNKEQLEKIFNNDIVCYFTPERYEKPFWLGNPYFKDVTPHIVFQCQYGGEINNPIIANDLGKENLQWLLDIIADSRIDQIEWEIDQRNEKGNESFTYKNSVMMGARHNIETIMSEILGEDIYFSLNIRSAKQGRFNIKRKVDGSIVSPTLDSLSTGQLALFNLFATILRYADNNLYMNSIGLSIIKGIVIIDEIELHLHTSLQKKILPELIKLFPKVQFIITTHSPLFLLGMEDVFGSDGYEIYQLPEANKIDVERFREFKRAYQYYTETETYQKRIIQIIKEQIKEDSKPLIITEGKTDWKHMEAAYHSLSAKPKYKDWFDGFDFEFCKYDSKIDMGSNNLVSMCKSFAKIPNSRKIIFIADRDDSKINKELSVGDNKYKSWGNNVFSFILPVPPNRVDTPLISIEHYYTDGEIKTVYQDGDISRRLFMGNEFDERGISRDETFCCMNRNACGQRSIEIIEGSSKDRVTKIHDSDGARQNYALPKSKFADLVLNKIPPFNQFDFTNFIEIFKIIKIIIEENP